MTDVKRLLDEATPLPWRDDPLDGIVTDDGEVGGAVHAADAALIVHAVNSLPDYEAAVDALERIMDMWPDDGSLLYAGIPNGETLDEARAVLRRLREKVPA